MRNALLGLILLGGMLVGTMGCDRTSEQRVSLLQTMVMQMQKFSIELDDKVAKLEAALQSAQVLLTDPNTNGEMVTKLRRDMAALQAQIAAVKPVKQALDQQLVAYQKLLTEAQAAGPIDAQKEVALYGQGVTSVGAALPPPWNVLALLLGTVVLPLGGAVGGALVKGKKDSTQIAKAQATNETAIQGIVESVNELLKKLAEQGQAQPGTMPIVLDVETAKSILARAQVKVPEAAAAVRVALDKIAETAKLAA